MSYDSRDIEEHPGRAMHLAGRQEDGAVGGRRAGGQDRRKPGSRINHGAPRQSVLRVMGAIGVAFSLAPLSLTVIGGGVLGLTPSPVLVSFEAGALLISLLMIALGSIESRLMEIRLELVMLNGDERTGVRRKDMRRSEERESST